MKKFLCVLMLSTVLFTGCRMMDNSPKVTPIITIAPSETIPPSTQGKASFSIDDVAVNEKIGVFTVTEVKKDQDKATYVKAEGSLTVNGVYARLDMLNDLDRKLYSEEGDIQQFALLKCQRTAGDALPKEDELINFGELTVVVKLKQGNFSYGYGNVEIDLKNICYINDAGEYKYYTYDAEIKSEEELPEHDFSRQ